MAAKKRPKTAKKPKESKAKKQKTTPGKPKPAKAKRGGPKAVPFAEVSCEQCVRNAVDQWCGQEVISSKTTLKDAFAPNGACNNGSLRSLSQILEDTCGVEIDPDNLSCSMTLGDLITLICGS